MSVNGVDRLHPQWIKLELMSDSPYRQKQALLPLAVYVYFWGLTFKPQTVA